jgi:hypothetical protein
MSLNTNLPGSASNNHGLFAEYYNNRNFTDLALTRIDSTVNFNWRRGAPDSRIGENTFSVRWTGQVQALYSETYTFSTIADDGVRLWVDGKLLIDRWRNSSAKERRGSITLEAGKQYDIKLEYYENRGKAVAQLKWSSRSQRKEIIPTSQLFHANNSTPNPSVPNSGGTGSTGSTGNTGSTGSTGGTSAIPLSPTNNLDISAATYLGDLNQDFANAVDISLDSKVVILGGALPTYNPGGAQFNLLGGGNGAIVRYDNTTNQVLSTTRLPGAVKDLEVNSATAQIIVVGDFGVAALNADANQVLWYDASITDASRVSVAASGTVAVMRDSQNTSDRIAVYNSQGQQIQQWSTGLSTRQFNDVTITDNNGGMVIATGYDQKTSVLQVAFAQAWSYTGAEQWKSYDFSAASVQSANLMADTRGERITIGRDGQLYLAGSINGGTGASIFARDPLNLAQSAAPDTVITDSYTNPTNVGSIKMAWYGRYDLNTGDLIKGQSLLTRLSSGKGNTLNIDSITADELGNVYLSGSAAASIANRDSQQIEGQLVAPYAPFDGHLAIISADFSQRYIWTPLSDAVVKAFNVRKGVAAAAVSTDSQQPQITHNALQSNPGGATDAYLLVIGGTTV